MDNAQADSQNRKRETPPPLPKKRERAKVEATASVREKVSDISVVDKRKEVAMEDLRTVKGIMELKEALDEYPGIIFTEKEKRELAIKSLDNYFHNLTGSSIYPVPKDEVNSLTEAIDYAQSELGITFTKADLEKMMDHLIEHWGNLPDSIQVAEDYGLDMGPERKKELTQEWIRTSYGDLACLLHASLNKHLKYIHDKNKEMGNILTDSEITAVIVGSIKSRQERYPTPVNSDQLKGLIDRMKKVLGYEISGPEVKQFLLQSLKYEGCGISEMMGYIDEYTKNFGIHVTSAEKSELLASHLEGYRSVDPIVSEIGVAERDFGIHTSPAQKNELLGKALDELSNDPNSYEKLMSEMQKLEEMGVKLSDEKKRELATRPLNTMMRFAEQMNGIKIDPGELGTTHNPNNLEAAA